MIDRPSTSRGGFTESTILCAVPTVATERATGIRLFH